MRIGSSLIGSSEQSVYYLVNGPTTDFLTDYILGDVYFKVKYLEHNLVRTKNQLALARDVKLKMQKMQEILEKYI